VHRCTSLNTAYPRSSGGPIVLADMGIVKTPHSKSLESDPD